MSRNLNEFEDPDVRQREIERWDHIVIVSGADNFLDRQGQVLDIIRDSPMRNFWKLKICFQDGSLETVRYSNVQFLRKGLPNAVFQPDAPATLPKQLAEPTPPRPAPIAFAQPSGIPTAVMEAPSEIGGLSNNQLIMLGIASLLDGLGNDAALVNELRRRCGKE